MQFTTDIPAVNLTWLSEKLAALSKRAVKLGMPELNMTVGEVVKTIRTKLATGQWREDAIHTITINGETPKLNGWSLVAVLEYAANGEVLVKCVPGEACPEVYRTTDYHCDHCGHRRRRSQVFVVRHDDGTHKQVGRSCLKDFLGHTSPESYASMAELLGLLEREVADGPSDEYFGSGAARTFNVAEFLATTAICIRRLGWISRKTAGQRADAEQRPVASTSDTTIYLLTPPRGSQAKADLEEFVERQKLTIEDRDIELANAALEWAKAMPRGAVSDYEYNLGVACRQERVTDETAGLVASAIAAYQRHLDRENELHLERKAAAEKQHVGTVGERGTFTGLKCVKLQSFDGGTYGRVQTVKTLCRFEDEAGNVIIWWASGDTDWLEVDGVYDVIGTVKEHGEYRGAKQTVLTRVKQQKATACCV